VLPVFLPPSGEELELRMRRATANNTIDAPIGIGLHRKDS
jgi:hypothetical protein